VLEKWLAYPWDWNFKIEDGIGLWITQTQCWIGSNEIKRNLWSIVRGFSRIALLVDKISSSNAITARKHNYLVSKMYIMNLKSEYVVVFLPKVEKWTSCCKER